MMRTRSAQRGKRAKGAESKKNHINKLRRRKKMKGIRAAANANNNNKNRTNSNAETKTKMATAPKWHNQMYKKMLPIQNLAELEVFCASQHCDVMRRSNNGNVQFRCRHNHRLSKCMFRALYIAHKSAIYVPVGRNVHNHKVEKLTRARGNHKAIPLVELLSGPSGQNAYIDLFGKQWAFQAHVADNGQHLEQLRRQLYLRARSSHNCLNLNFYCKRSTALGCRFRALYCQRNSCLYVRGEHNHPLEANGDETTDEQQEADDDGMETEAEGIELDDPHNDTQIVDEVTHEHKCRLMPMKRECDVGAPPPQWPMVEINDPEPEEKYALTHQFRQQRRQRNKNNKDREPKRVAIKQEPPQEREQCDDRPTTSKNAK